MKKTLLTMVAIGLISSMLTTTAYAGNHHRRGGDFNPLWIPAAILSTIVAVTAIAQPPVVYERRGYYEPERVVIINESERYETDDYSRRGRSHYRDTYDYDYDYDSPRYRHHR
jgi:hypothetical protein